MKIFTTSILLLPLMLFSCNRQSNSRVSSDMQMNFDISAVGSVSSTKADPITVSTGTLSSFSDGESVGLFVTRNVLEQVTLPTTASNVYSNIQTTKTGGQFVPASSMYYPSRQDKVTAFAYFPYSAALTDPSSYIWPISTDQKAADIRSSDFLFTSTTQAPSNEIAQAAIPLIMKHALSLVQIKVKVPEKFIDKSVADLVKASILNTVPSATINIAKLTTLVTPNIPTADIQMALVSKTKETDQSTTYIYEAIVAPHQFKTGQQLFSCEMKYDGAPNDPLVYVPKTEVNFKGGDCHQITLTVSDYGKLNVTTSVVPWNNDNVATGKFDSKGVANKMIFNLLELGNGSFVQENTKAIRISVTKADKNKVTYLFKLTKGMVVVAGANNIMTNVECTFPDASGALPEYYPFTIDKVELFNDEALATNTAYTLDMFTKITNTGDVNIPLYNYYKLNTSGSTLQVWGSAVQGNVPGIVSKLDNTFRYMFINSTATTTTPCSSATILELTIGGQALTFPAFTMYAGEANGYQNVGISYSIDSANLTAAVGTKPTAYPFTITKVRFLSGTKELYSSGVTSVTVQANGEVVLLGTK